MFSQERPAAAINQPTCVTKLPPNHHNQLFKSASHAFLLFSCRIIQSNSPSSAQGFAASQLGVIVRTPLGGIAAHARDRSRTRQAR